MDSTTQKIDMYIDSLPAWQAANLREFRALVHDAVPAVTEDWKWAVPVFVYDGRMLFAMSAFKDHTKFNFLTGATLSDQSMFNGGLDSKSHRSVNLTDGEPIDRDALRAVLTAAAKV